MSKALRMRRVFGPDGRTLIVAMDHASFMGPVPGLADPVATVRKVVAGGADAVMTTFGTATRILDVLDGRGLILSVDLHAPDPEALVEQAVALGADSLKTLAFPMGDDAAGVRAVGRYGALCQRWGLPFQAEMIPFSFAAADKHTPENIAMVARIGAELGADYVKVQYTGDPDTFRRVTDGAGVPVIILGGAKTERPVTTQVADALRAGGAGIAFGRNIWSASDPEAAAREFATTIHGGVGAPSARTAQVVRA